MTTNDDVDEPRGEHEVLIQSPLATVRLLRLEANDLLPSAMTSGFVCQRNSRYFVISAAHAMANGRWWLEVNAVRDGQPTGLFVPFVAQWAVLHSFTVPDRARKMELVWAELDVAQLRRQASHASGKTLELIEYRGPLSGRPNMGEAYTFSALNHPLDPPKADEPFWIERRPVSEWRMTHTGYNTSGVYTFRLSADQQGRESHEGVTGAPIVNRTGEIVSVVLGGNLDRKWIYGARLAEFEGHIGELTTA